MADVSLNKLWAAVVVVVVVVVVMVVVVVAHKGHKLLCAGLPFLGYEQPYVRDLFCLSLQHLNLALFVWYNL